jgi:hypothetical protein
VNGAAVAAGAGGRVTGIELLEYRRQVSDDVPDLQFDLMNEV